MCSTKRIPANVCPSVTFALVGALGLVGIIALQVIVRVREADAKECNYIISFNASEGRCFHTWLGEEVRIDR